MTLRCIRSLKTLWNHKFPFCKKNGQAIKYLLIPCFNILWWYLFPNINVKKYFTDWWFTLSQLRFLCRFCNLDFYLSNLDHNWQTPNRERANTNQSSFHHSYFLLPHSDNEQTKSLKVTLSKHLGRIRSGVVRLFWSRYQLRLFSWTWQPCALSASFLSSVI